MEIVFLLPSYLCSMYHSIASPMRELSPTPHSFLLWSRENLKKKGDWLEYEVDLECTTSSLFLPEIHKIPKANILMSESHVITHIFTSCKPFFNDNNHLHLSCIIHHWNVVFIIFTLYTKPNFSPLLKVMNKISKHVVQRHIITFYFKGAHIICQNKPANEMEYNFHSLKNLQLSMKTRNPFIFFHKIPTKRPFHEKSCCQSSKLLCQCCNLRFWRGSI